MKVDAIALRDHLRIIQNSPLVIRKTQYGTVLDSVHVSPPRRLITLLDSDDVPGPFLAKTVLPASRRTDVADFLLAEPGSVEVEVSNNWLSLILPVSEFSYGFMAHPFPVWDEVPIPYLPETSFDGDRLHALLYLSHGLGSYTACEDGVLRISSRLFYSRSDYSGFPDFRANNDTVFAIQSMLASTNSTFDVADSWFISSNHYLYLPPSKSLVKDSKIPDKKMDEFTPLAETTIPSRLLEVIYNVPHREAFKVEFTAMGKKTKVRMFASIKGFSHRAFHLPLELPKNFSLTVPGVPFLQSLRTGVETLSVSEDGVMFSGSGTQTLLYPVKSYVY